MNINQPMFTTSMSGAVNNREIMSRFHEWTRAESGIRTWINRQATKQGLTLDIRGVKGKTDRYFGVETKKMILSYFKSKNLKGSYTTKILNTDFHDFVRWFKIQDWSHLK